MYGLKTLFRTYPTHLIFNPFSALLFGLKQYEYSQPSTINDIPLKLIYILSD